MLQETKQMPKTTPDEDIAVEHGGDLAGAYLDELGKFDLRELSRREWREFLRRILKGYSARMRDFAEEVPF